VADNVRASVRILGSINNNKQHEVRSRHRVQVILIASWRDAGSGEVGLGVLGDGKLLGLVLGPLGWALCLDADVVR